jgi:transcriptional regulator with XRE-family HTH domain
MEHTMEERPEFYEALGRTIQVLRTDRGVDRKDLAESAGISYSYLAAIETGKKQPSSTVLLRIAEALGLRSHELMQYAESRADRQSARLSMRARQPADAPATMAAPSRRSPWFHGEPADESPPLPREMDPRSLYSSHLVSEPPVQRRPQWFLDRMADVADDLTADDHELLVETALKLAERHRISRPSRSGE